MRGRGGWRAIGSVCKSRGTLCCDAAGSVAGSSGLGKLFPALLVPLCCNGALRMAHGCAGAILSGGLTWGRGGTEPTRCCRGKQRGRGNFSVGPTRERQGREVAREGQDRVFVGGAVPLWSCWGQGRQTWIVGTRQKGRIAVASRPADYQPPLFLRLIEIKSGLLQETRKACV